MPILYLHSLFFKINVRARVVYLFSHTGNICFKQLVPRTLYPIVKVKTFQFFLTLPPFPIFMFVI